METNKTFHLHILSDGGCGTINLHFVVLVAVTLFIKHGDPIGSIGAPSVHKSAPTALTKTHTSVSGSTAVNQHCCCLRTQEQVWEKHFRNFKCSKISSFF